MSYNDYYHANHVDLQNVNWSHQAEQLLHSSNPQNPLPNRQHNVQVQCAVNPHKRIYPASMTKILTAIVVMDAVNSGQISYHCCQSGLMYHFLKIP